MTIKFQDPSVDPLTNPPSMPIKVNGFTNFGEENPFVLLMNRCCPQFYAPGSFKSLVHDALGAAAERAYKVLAPFEDTAEEGIDHDGSGDPQAGWIWLGRL